MLGTASVCAGAAVNIDFEWELAFKLEGDLNDVLNARHTRWLPIAVVAPYPLPDPAISRNSSGLVCAEVAQKGASAASDDERSLGL
jgi:hypothetical protein